MTPEKLPVLGEDDGWGVAAPNDPFIQGYYVEPPDDERCASFCMTSTGAFRCIRRIHDEGDGEHVIWA